jgi:hypothetical protein
MPVSDCNPRAGHEGGTVAPEGLPNPPAELSALRGLRPLCIPMGTCPFEASGADAEEAAP